MKRIVFFLLIGVLIFTSFAFGEPKAGLILDLTVSLPPLGETLPPIKADNLPGGYVLDPYRSFWWAGKVGPDDVFYYEKISGWEGGATVIPERMYMAEYYFVPTEGEDDLWVNVNGVTAEKAEDLEGAMEMALNFKSASFRDEGGYVVYAQVLPAMEEELPPITEQVVTFEVGDPSYGHNFGRQIMDVAPYIKENRMMLPVRFVAEGLNMVVDWDPAKRMVALRDSDQEVLIFVDRAMVTVNGRPGKLDVKPDMRDNRTFLPIGIIGEIMGMTRENPASGNDISWDSATRTATIRRKVR